MFFIMGISDGNKRLAFDQPIVCPCCGRFGRLEVFMKYTFFSLFFIPLFKWNKQYFVRATCCAATCALSAEAGGHIKSGETTQLDLDSLHFSCKYGGACKRCAACGYETAEDFSYCPKCGRPF